VQGTAGVRRELTTLGIAILLTAAWELPFGGIRVGHLVVHPGMPAYVLVALFAAPLAWRSRRLWHTWELAAFVAVCDAPAMACRSSLPEARLGQVAVGMVLAAAVMGLLYATRRFEQNPRISGRTAGVVFLTMLGVVVVFQVANRMLRAGGVPNTARSMMIGQVEIHHLYAGILITVLAVILRGLGVRGRVSRGAILLALGVGCGLVWDQWLYCMSVVITDDGYFTASTVVSAVFGCHASLLVWVVPGIRGRQHPETGSGPYR